METSDSGKMSGSMGDSSPAEVIAQKWDDQKQRLVRTVLRAPEAEIDVKYDALIANRRTLDDPEMISVDSGESVLLRLIAAASNTNFVAFDADNAGIWALHCHLLYHLDTGMFTVLRYDGSDAKFWQPEAQAKEFEGSK